MNSQTVSGAEAVYVATTGQPFDYKQAEVELWTLITAILPHFVDEVADSLTRNPDGTPGLVETKIAAKRLICSILGLDDTEAGSFIRKEGVYGAMRVEIETIP